MTRILGTTLTTAPSTPSIDCLNRPIRCKDACRLVPHHDHMYDFIHHLLLDELSPPEFKASRQRPDAGAAFGRLVLGSGEQIVARLQEEKLANGRPLIRFPTTLICQSLNAVDGNGKTSPRHSDLDEAQVRWWSMTPEELVAVQDGTKSWREVFDEDTEISVRMRHAEALASRIIQRHLDVQTEP